MSQSWEDAATALAEQIVSVLGLTVNSERLTDKLLRLRIIPVSRESSPISLVISRCEVLFFAGNGTQFDLSPLPESASELLRLVEGVAHGGLTEVTRRGRVKFELRLDDGTVRTGASYRRSPQSGTGGRMVIHYKAYGDPR